MKAGILPAAILLAIGACGGGGSPVLTAPAPAPMPAAPQPPSWRLAGIVVDTLTGAPVAGASLAFAGRAPVTTSSDGRWQIDGTGMAAIQAVAITNPGFLDRETTVRPDAAGRDDVRLELIAERPPFRLDFYRQFARDALDAPETLRSIRRWERAPNFYVDVTNPKTGERLTPSEVALIEHALRTAVPQLTGGMFQAGVIDTGHGPADPRKGYIAVTFVYEPDADFCGWAYVGANPGEITMNYDRCFSGCGRFAPETLAHEVGHALGFFHTAGPGIMHTHRRRHCDNLDFSADERAHAAIVYARPNGNQDVDRDPSGFVAAESGTSVRVRCSG